MILRVAAMGEFQTRRALWNYREGRFELPKLTLTAPSVERLIVKSVGRDEKFGTTRKWITQIIKNNIIHYMKNLRVSWNFIVLFPLEFINDQSILKFHRTFSIGIYKCGMCAYIDTIFDNKFSEMYFWWEAFVEPALILTETNFDHYWNVPRYLSIPKKQQYLRIILELTSQPCMITGS